MKTAEPTIWFQIRNNYAEEWWNARQGAKPLKFRTEASARLYIEQQRELMALDDHEATVVMLTETEIPA